MSQLSWRWIDHPTDILNVGDKIDVEVIAVDHDKQRVSLSLKNLEPDPWLEAEKQIKEGDKVEGTITRIKHFGAFVEVFPGVEALLPHNEVVELQNRDGNILQVGDKIMTYIMKFNPTDKRISRKILLSLIFTLKLLIPILRRAFAVVWINSISQVEESDPRISISHWINSLKRPFCGRSARYTLSI